jgi:parallel beta-helix repeat protein
LELATGKHLWNYTHTEYHNLCDVVDGRIFLRHNEKIDNSDTVIGNVVALDALTGNQIWNYTIWDSADYVEIDESSVYIGSNNTVYALDVSTGTEKWTDTPEDHEAKGLVAGHSSVYVSYGDSLHCLDASTGDTKWALTDVDVDYGFYVFGDEVYFGTEGSRDRKSLPLDSTIYCLDAHTGTQIFNYTIEGDPFDMAMIDGILYVAADYPFLYIFLETGYLYALKPIIESIPESSSVYIRPDGSVEGTDKIQREGNVYTFSDNINAEITVEIDDIVIDGANYSLQGNGDGVGIHVPNNGNVEIKNVKIQGFKFAIYFDYYSKNNNIISGNTLTNNTDYGIHITNSHNNTISGNYIEDSGTGIQLVESYNNTISQNRIIGNAEGIGLGSGGGHSTVFHNLISDNGYAFTFWANSHNTIYENNLINNTNQVNAWTSSNNWDYDSMGNYWSDYNGTDENNDGIGDTPYVISTSPEDYGDADNYPLIEPVDDSLIPEFPSWAILPLVLTITLFSVVIKRNISKRNNVN